MTAGNKVLFLSVRKNRNEEKDPLANKKQECQSIVTKKKKKIRKWKVSTSEECSDSSSKHYSSPAKKKKAKRRRHHQPTSSSSSTASDSSTESNRIMRCLKLSLKIKNLDRNYPKVWSITQTNILKSKFQRIVWKRLYYAKTRSRIIFKEVRWFFKGHLERKT